MHLSVYLVLLVCTRALCDTRSYLHHLTSEAAVEIKLLKDEVNSLRQQMNYDRTARLDLDKELTSMTTRYRKLEMEFDDIKVQLKSTMEKGQNYTDEGDRQLLSMIQNIQQFADSSLNTIQNMQRNLSQIVQKGLSYIAIASFV